MARQRHPIRRLLRFRPTKEAPSTTSTVTTAASQDIDDWDDVYADVRSQLDSKSNCVTPRCAHTVPWLIAYTCYLAYAILLILGQLRDLLGRIFGRSRYGNARSKKYAPLLNNWEKTYTRRIYHRIQDCFNRPIASRPGTRILVLERASCDGKKSFELLQKDALSPRELNEYTSSSLCVPVSGPLLNTHHNNSQEFLARDCLNLGSYNYLGFADDFKETCQHDVVSSLDSFSVSTNASLQTFGRTKLHDDLDSTVAAFVGKPAAICFNMGYNTNASVLPALVGGPNDLIISDALNHTSIVNGARASGAAIRTFEHDNVRDLESILRQAILLGHPRTRRPWKKILVVVEGVYSMEGEYCDLKNIVRVCKQYGAYLYLDEAHSIGAMGMTGRGIAEYCEVDPADIDIMMGTFTKSFGAMGGYIAASKEIIDYLRVQCAGSVLHTSMSPMVCQQVLTAFKVGSSIAVNLNLHDCATFSVCQSVTHTLPCPACKQVITGQDGTNIGRKKLQALRDNSNYFRMRLEQMGLQVLGQYDSPVVPVMLYHMTKIASFSRECFKRGLAIVVVGAPAVPVLECRARFCMSAAHKRCDLDWALEQLEEIVEICKIRHGKEHDNMHDVYIRKIDFD
jgi:serine palmitoyltransferase